MKKKILLIGPVPPPSGGVSVHVARLASKLNLSEDFECAVFNVGRLHFYDQKNQRRNLLFALFYFSSTKIVHLHISHPRKYFIAKIAKLLGKKIVYTQHNIRDYYTRATLILHKIADAAIIVSKIPNLVHDNKTKLIPAYIPADSVLPLNNRIIDQLSKFETKIVAISTHPKIGPVKIGGKDLYGFDLLLEAYLNFHRPGQLLVLVDSNGVMKSEYQEKVERINRKGLPVIYLTEEVDFTALLPFTSIYVRPTRSDGDSLAIREALNFGVGVLASDCVERPEGVVLFKDGDITSLAEKMDFLISQPIISPIIQHDFSQAVIDIYRSL